MVLNGTQILVVDDEPEILTLFRIFLESEGCSVETAATAREALGLINAKKFDLAIIDVNLPDSHGTALPEKFSLIQPDLMKIVISGDDMNEEFRTMPGIDEYLVKPVKKRVLLGMIENMIVKRGLPNHTAK